MSQLGYWIYALANQFHRQLKPAPKVDISVVDSCIRFSVFVSSELSAKDLNASKRWGFVAFGDAVLFSGAAAFGHPHPDLRMAGMWLGQVVFRRSVGHHLGIGRGVEVKP